MGKIYYLNPAAKKLFPDLELKKNKHPYLTDINYIYKRLKNSKSKHFTREVKVDNIWLNQVFQLVNKTNKIRIYGLDISKSKTTEDSLRESEKMLKKTQEIAHIGTWSLDFGSMRPYWSEETFRIYGYNPKKFTPVNDAFDRLIHPDDRKRVLEAYHNSIKERKSNYSNTFRIVDQLTGNIRLLYEKSEHILNESGEIIRTIGMVQDITERQKAENELRKLSRISKTLNSSSKIMSYALDESEYLNDVCSIVLKECGYFMVWVGLAQNDEYKSVLPVAYAGFNKEYIESLKISWSDTSQYGRGPTGTAIRTGQPIVCRNMLTDPNFVPWRKAALKNGYTSSLALPLMTQGKTFGSITIYSKEPDPFSEDEIKLLTELSNDLAYGITAIRLRKKNKKDEEELHKFSQAVEQSLASIVITDLNGNIEYVNQGFINTTGYSQKEAMGNNPKILKSGLTSQKTYQDLWQTITAGKEWKGELCNKKKNGDLYWEQVSISPIKNAEGKITNYLAVKNDITELKNIDQQKDDFITIAGHELRTPVSAIRLTNQILQEILTKNPQALKYLEKIERQSSIQVNLINDLLSVSKIQTGKMEIRKEKFKLEDLVKEVIDTMQKIAPEHQIIIKSKFQDKIYTDRERISQILTNFCSNAIKYSPNGKKITIEIKKTDKEAIVSVTDYGIGIAKEHHHGIFKRFYRVYGSGNEGYPGLGMGLYISHQIIKLLDGQMWFESEPEKGSTFYFSLPL
jgi:PAS domain S-box-containing protein